MTSAVLTPFARTAASSPAPARWRKRLLPVGEIDYKGRRIRFDRPYLQGLAEAFAANAYDQVPFQLAGDTNSHTNDVERFGGRVEAMDLGQSGEEPGLWVTLATTERGTKVLTDNPGLGVSARIVEDYDRSDGKFFPRAIQHVLGTLDPRIPGLGAWRAVEAANDDIGITIDLSGMEFAGEGTADMPELSEEQKRQRLAALLAIPPEQLEDLIAGLAVDDGTPPPTGGDDGEMSDAELEELVQAAERLDAQGLLGDEGQPAPQGQPAGQQAPEPVGAASFSQDALLALELSNARADQNALELAEVRGYLDNERYLAERRGFAEDHGIPPYITDFARPLLEGSGHVVDLANGTQADAGAIMRKVLTEFGKLGKLLDLGVELGSPLDEPDQQAVGAQHREQFVTDFKNQTGIG